ncbi:fungal-specific transcription factor domain-containing protein [Aspergillus filifer]
MDRRHGPTRKRLRVNTGCRTCRTRRVKCGEEKPKCRNCAKKNRVCVYSSGQSRETSENGDPVVIEDGRNDHPGRSPPSSPDLGSVFLQRAHSPFHNGTIDSLTTSANVPPAPDSLPTERVDNGQFSAAPTRIVVSNEPIQLTSEEVPIFRNYVETVSRWIDSFSPDRPFYSIVPIIALTCPALMYSCLSLGAKQLALKSPVDEQNARANVAIGYYQKAVRTVSALLADPTYASNDGILASSIILSTYEMLEPAGESFGSHLKGIAFFLQAHQANGDAQGIKGAAYWTWYRHEIWAALQTGRRMFLEENYWQPKQLDSFSGLSVEGIANRVLFIFGQCISFCNDCITSQENKSDTHRQDQDHRAISLDAALERWKNMLPSSMTHFFAERPPSADGRCPEFPFMWFIYPQSAIAFQVYHASKILLRLHSPSMPSEFPGGDRIQSLTSRREIEKSREQIFMVSNAGVPDAWSLVSTQCLYIAGLVTEGVLERHHTLILIENCQRTSGRRTVCLADELRKLWTQ